MADSAKLTVSFGNEADNDDSVRLEQKPWDQQGTTTAMDLINAMATMFFGDTLHNDTLHNDRLLNDCGYDLTDRSITTEIYAYPSRLDLVFRIGVTMGTLAGGGLETVPVVESLDFNLQDSATLSYLPHGAVSVSWLGDVFNIDGDTVDPPAISVSGDGVFSALPVYGSIKAVYTKFRYRYTLRIDPREASPENSFQATVWAAWDGGVTMLTTTDPPGAEEDLQNDTDCNNRGGWSVLINPNDGDDDVPTVPPGGVETITLDYCLYGEGYYDK